jgi:heptaprenylglyceryl phosphate synthase
VVGSKNTKHTANAKVYTTTHNHFYMNIKYIEGSMMLTKEAFEQYIQQARNAEAIQYGLTLEEYNQAIMSGSVVQAKSLPDL